MIERDGIICEKESKCKWKCFALDKSGFAFGTVSDFAGAWMEWHEKECGGKLIPVKIMEKP